MNVLVVGTSGAVVSGITTAADQTVRTLEREGHTVHRVQAGTRRRRRPNRINVENIAAVGRDVMAVLRSVRAHRADVVWYHTFGVPTLPALRALAVMIAARLGGARAFVRLHPYDFHGWLDRGGWRLRAVLRLLDRVATGLVVEFDEAAGTLRSAVGSKRVVTLSNWVDVPVEPTPPPSDGPFTMIFVGGLIERKGVFEILGAMALLKDRDVHLLLVGGAGEDGPGAQERLEAAIDANPAHDRIEFLGELPGPAVRDALRRAHLFVLPTRAEGLPLAMLEAMAEGRPVVVGDAGAIRGVVSGADCGTVLVDTSPERIAATVRHWADDLDEVRAAGLRGHRAVSLTARASAMRLDDLVTGSS